MNLCTDFQKSVDGCAAANYLFLAGANSPVRGESLNTCADNRRQSVMRYFYVRDLPCCARIMVGRDGGATALAGLTSASLSTLLRPATPFESGRQVDKSTCEAAPMANFPLSAPQTYVFKFAAFDRSADVFLPVTVSVIAASEREARRAFARDYLLLMTARLPFADTASRQIAEVIHAE